MRDESRNQNAWRRVLEMKRRRQGVQEKKKKSHEVFIWPWLWKKKTLFLSSPGQSLYKTFFQGEDKCNFFVSRPEKHACIDLTKKVERLEEGQSRRELRVRKRKMGILGRNRLMKIVIFSDFVILVCMFSLCVYSLEMLSPSLCVLLLLLWRGERKRSLRYSNEYQVHHSCNQRYTWQWEKEGMHDA